MSSSVIRSSFFHSTPVASRRNRFNACPFIGEQFSCDVDAWLDLDQLASHIGNDSLNVTAINDEDWWMVELDAAAEYNPDRPNNDGNVKPVTRVVMRLCELATRMLGGKVVRGHRIRTTDRHLTRILTTQSVLLSKRKPVTDEMATMVTEEVIETIVKRETMKREVQMMKLAKKAAAEEKDSECDPEDDLCTCIKCRTLTE